MYNAESPTPMYVYTQLNASFANAYGDIKCII